MDIDCSELRALIVQARNSSSTDAFTFVKVLSKVLSVEWWLGQVCTIIRDEFRSAGQEKSDLANELLDIITDAYSLQFSEFTPLLSSCYPGLLSIAKWTSCAQTLDKTINALYKLRAGGISYSNASLSSLLIGHLEILLNKQDLLTHENQYAILELVIDMLCGANVRYIYPVDYYWIQNDGWNIYMRRLLDFAASRSEDTMLQRRIELVLVRYMQIATYWTEEGVYSSALSPAHQLAAPKWSPLLRKHLLRRMGEFSISDSAAAETADARAMDLHSLLNTDQSSFGYRKLMGPVNGSGGSLATVLSTLSKTHSLLMTSHLHLLRTALACISDDWLFSTEGAFELANGQSDSIRNRRDTSQQTPQSPTKKLSEKDIKFLDFHFLQVTANLLSVHAKLLLDEVDTCLIVPVNPVSSFPIDPIAAQPSVTGPISSPSSSSISNASNSLLTMSGNGIGQESDSKKVITHRKPSRVERLQTVLHSYNLWWNQLLCICNGLSFLSSLVTHKLESSTDEELSCALNHSDACKKLHDTLTSIAVYFLTVYADSDNSELRGIIKKNATSVSFAPTPCPAPSKECASDADTVPNTLPALLAAMRRSLYAGAQSYAEQEETSYAWRARLLIPLLSVLSTTLAPMLADNPELNAEELQDALALLVDLPSSFQSPLPVLPLELLAIDDAQYSQDFSQFLLLCAAPRCLKNSFFHLLPLLECRMYQPDIVNSVLAQPNFFVHGLRWLVDFSRVLQISIKEEAHVIDAYNVQPEGMHTTIHASSAPIVFHISTLANALKGCNVFLDSLASDRLSIHSMTGPLIEGAMKAATQLLQTAALLVEHNMHFSDFFHTEETSLAQQAHSESQGRIGISFRNALSQHLLAVVARIVSLFVKVGGKWVAVCDSPSTMKNCLEELRDIAFDAFRHVFGSEASASLSASSTKDQCNYHDSQHTNFLSFSTQRLLFDIVMEALSLDEC